MLVFLAGSPAAEVYASGFSRIGAPMQAHDNVAITVRHADGSLGTIAYVATSASGIGKERVAAFGPAGIGVLDDFRSLELHGGAEKSTKGAQRKGHAEELEAFVQALRAGRPPVPLEEVENVSLATIAAVESMRTGAAVRLDG
jgi:predicted dehydrogenase